MTSKAMRKLSIYIHIPFCVKKCLYCDFLSFPADEAKREQYVKALMNEIDTEAEKYREYTVDTVFFGGGTPSLLTGSQMKRIMERLKSSFAFVNEPEITTEMNPGTASYKRLAEYRDAGINRLSIGTQSVCDKELMLLGRIHTAEDFFRTYEDAVKAGFSNINVDIMSALPGQSMEQYRHTLQAVAKLEPQHISAYSLIIEEGTPFYDYYGDGKGEAAAKLPSEDEERGMYEYTEQFLLKKGYHRYEISNYARNGRECRHNIAYWKRYDYAGFGVGAASMINNVRWKNISDMETYIIRTARKEEVRENIEPLCLQEQMEEFMFLGLRLTQGVSAEEFNCIFGKKVKEVYGDTIKRLCGHGLITADSTICLTPYGRDISNYVMAQFLLD